MYDFSFDIWSYVYGIMALIFQATYLTMIERLSISNTYSPMEMMYMNAFNCLVFFLIADLVQDEIRDAFMYLMTSASTLFIFCFLLLMVLGMVLNYAMFMCTAINSALTTSIIGNLKAALLTFVGYYMSVYLFYDIVPNFMNGVGLIITIGGVGAYSYYKLLEKQRNPKPPIPTGRL
jgi:solute carrier family 35 protein